MQDGFGNEPSYEEAHRCTLNLVVVASINLEMVRQAKFELQSLSTGIAYTDGLSNIWTLCKAVLQRLERLVFAVGGIV